MMITPSILNANNLNLEEEIAQAVNAGINRFHIDIMDGHFVPNLSFGPQLVADFKREFPMTDAEIHLMSNNPVDLVPAFVKAGADLIELHFEAMAPAKLNYWFDYLASNNVKAGLAINPETPVAAVKPFLPKVKQVLLMTVRPGFGGQSFMTDSLPRIRQARTLLSKLPIEVDGGINEKTIKLAQEAGANIFVVGSYLFKNGNVAGQIRQLEKIFK